MDNSKYPMIFGQGERLGYYAYVLDWNSCCVKLRIPVGMFTFFYDEWYNWDEAMELYNFEGVEL